MFYALMQKDNLLSLLIHLQAKFLTQHYKIVAKGCKLKESNFCVCAWL